MALQLRSVRSPPQQRRAFVRQGTHSLCAAEAETRVRREPPFRAEVDKHTRCASRSDRLGGENESEVHCVCCFYSLRREAWGAGPDECIGDTREHAWLRLRTANYMGRGDDEPHV